jgi:16S rRNA (guanine1516-N2)-methyltransferase
MHDERKTRGSVAVCPKGASRRLHDRAASLAGELALPLAESDGGADPQRYVLLLVVTDQRLELRETGRRTGKPLFVDFVGGAVGFRRRAAGSRRQPIARAIGLRGDPPTVLDATAGLGRDSFLLACLGCTVIAVERSPVLGALLRDGLDRAALARDEELRTVVARISLTIGDAGRVLTGMAKDAAPDVVYLDPMYPPKKKSALAKKEMRICRVLVGDDDDAGELLKVARRVTRRRVVVKRLRHAPPLATDVATKYLGRTVRYDVYRPR